MISTYIYETNQILMDKIIKNGNVVKMKLVKSGKLFRNKPAKNGELLITTNTSYERVSLSGIEDYLGGGITKLNNAASKYSDEDLANTARRIDYDDINRITGFNPEVDGSEVGYVSEYGNEVTYTLKDDGKV